MRIQFLFKVMGICDHWCMGPARLQFSIISVHVPPLLYFNPPKLFNFDFYADPDPDFHSDADLEKDTASKIMRIRIQIRNPAY
jgi:hypothetical protein